MKDFLSRIHLEKLMLEGDPPAIRILIVDDHVIMRQGLRLLLEDYPNMVVVAEAGNKDETFAATARERPDVILLDLDLGGENAVDFLSELLATDEGVRVLVLTGVRDPELHRRAINLGAMGIVMKERASDFLIKAIEKVHGGEVWLDRVTIAQVLIDFRRAGRNPKPDRCQVNIASLTEREREIVLLITEGLTTTLLAKRLFISQKTVRNHLSTIYSKLEVSDRLELALFAFRNGLARPPLQKKARAAC
jgi:two-component system nitrate/nitrite response regulator NarL